MLCYAQVMGTLNARRAAGGCWVDPPAVSRIHQTMSEGMKGFQQAAKLEDTPLPFPYAQFVSFALFAFLLTFPILSTSKSNGEEGEDAPWLAILISIITTMSFFSLHEVARELEVRTRGDPAAVPPRAPRPMRPPLV
jgi:predicted membrane chloride channel (bestrophin family)